MKPPKWWTSPWGKGTDEDPDEGWVDRATNPGSDWDEHPDPTAFADEAILAPLEAQFGGQTRSRARVRDLAEVFTHQREVDAMLDLIPDAFTAIDVKFFEPACGSGNFLTEILRRKLAMVAKADCVSQEQYEHRLLRALSSIYGIDISTENVTEARARMAHVVLGHYQADANTILPTTGFLNAAALIIGDNIVLGDTLKAAADIELCDWQPRAGGCFQRVWSPALVPPGERDLFWAERVQDFQPVHYTDLVSLVPPAKPVGRKARAAK